MEKACLHNIALETHYLLNEKDSLIQKQQEQINNLELKFNRLKDQYDHLYYLFRITQKNVVDIDFFTFQK